MAGPWKFRAAIGALRRGDGCGVLSPADDGVRRSGPNVSVILISCNVNPLGTWGRCI